MSLAVERKCEAHLLASHCWQVARKISLDLKKLANFK